MAPPDHVLPSRWATRDTAVRQPWLALLATATGPASLPACLHMHEAAAPQRQVFSLGKMVFGLNILDR